MGEKGTPRSQGQACCLSPRNQVEEQPGQCEYGGAGKLSLTSAIHPPPPRTWWEINIVLLISDIRFCVSRDQLLPALIFYRFSKLFIFHFVPHGSTENPVMLVSGSQVLTFFFLSSCQLPLLSLLPNMCTPTTSRDNKLPHCKTLNRKQPIFYRIHREHCGEMCGLVDGHDEAQKQTLS